MSLDMVINGRIYFGFGLLDIIEFGFLVPRLFKLNIIERSTSFSVKSRLCCG